MMVCATSSSFTTCPRASSAPLKRACHAAWLSTVTGAAPGFGTAGWRRSVALLRASSAAPGLPAGRPATLADYEGLVLCLPLMGGLRAEELVSLRTGDIDHDSDGFDGDGDSDYA